MINIGLLTPVRTSFRLYFDQSFVIYNATVKGCACIKQRNKKNIHLSLFNLD